VFAHLNKQLTATFLQPAVPEGSDTCSRIK